MRKIHFTLCLILALGINQTKIQAQESSEFKPSGKVIARSFINYHTGFGEANDIRGFDIERAFLGYDYKITPNLSAKVVLDGASGKSSSGSLEIYLRNAVVNWKDKGFNINVGLTNLMQFSTQEKFWMHRYILRSFQDEYKMAPSVDLGTTIEYTFNPFISADISLTNGEGYKKVKQDNSMRYAAGISIHPIKEITLRVYADIYNDDKTQRDALPEGISETKYNDQKTLSFFAGYQDKNISFGAEYNRVYNKGFIDKKDYFGYSFYTSAKLAPKWRAFARYDLIDSKNPDNFISPWSKYDRQFMMIGTEFQPFKQIKIAPNFRNINADREKSEQYLFINLEINL